MPDQQLPPITSPFSRAPKGYTVTLMHTGEANGWTFTSPVLQTAAPLADGASCFIDHNLWDKSVRDLAGVFSEVRFENDALIATLTPAGPAADILAATAEYMLSESQPKPDVGFSPIIRFTSQEKTVQQILAFQSIDLVIDPAFQTKFLTEVFKQKENNDMPQNLDEMKTVTSAQAAVSRVIDDETRAAAITHEFQAIADAQIAAQNQIDEAKATHLAMCNQLLATSLQAAKLPDRAAAIIRDRFTGRTFKPDELSAEIQSMKDAVDEVRAPSQVVGPSHITGMFNTRDQIQAAVYDLFQVPRDPGTESLQVRRLSGIRDLYLGLTGDNQFHGALNADLAYFQHTTATFPGLVKNAMNKALVKGWELLGKTGYDWWTHVVKVEPFSTLNDVTWLQLGTIGSLPTIAEGADYPELKIGDGAETSTWEKVGGFIGVTIEALLRDDTRKIKEIPLEMGKAAIRNISEKIAAIFTANSGVGPTMADGGALFNATAVTTAGGHANLLTTALGTDYTAWEAVATAIYNQPLPVANETGYYGTGKKQAIDPRYILVPRALRGAANNLFLSRDVPGASVSLSSGKEWYGMVVPLTVPEWTDTTDWAAVCDKEVAPALMIGQIFGLMPEIFIAGSETDPAVFTNDESRFKIRHFLTYGVSDFRPLHKSNVA